MSLSDYYDSKIPDYYDTMYLDGYTPDQILYSVHRKMVREIEARKRAKAEANEIPNVKIVSEVKIK